MLHWVCALGDLAKANAVLSIPGVQVNEQDNAGWTPLMIAGMGCLGCILISVSAGKEDIAERLLEGTEVDVLLQNRNGATALYSLSWDMLSDKRHYAASKNRIHVPLPSVLIPSAPWAHPPPL